jgi:hypothetical protein
MDIPRTLCEYIETHARCMCGMACFEYHFKLTTMFELNRMAKAFTYLRVNGMPESQVPLDMHLCSWSCFRRNCKLKILC